VGTSINCHKATQIGQSVTRQLFGYIRRSICKRQSCKQHIRPPTQILAHWLTINSRGCIFSVHNDSVKEIRQTAFVIIFSTSYFASNLSMHSTKIDKSKYLRRDQCQTFSIRYEIIWKPATSAEYRYITCTMEKSVKHPGMFPLPYASKPTIF